MLLLLTGPIFLLLLPACLAPLPRTVYSNHWAVRIPGGPEEAARLADKYGYVNLGKVGDLIVYRSPHTPPITHRGGGSDLFYIHNP